MDDAKIKFTKSLNGKITLTTNGVFNLHKVSLIGNQNNLEIEKELVSKTNRMKRKIAAVVLVALVGGAFFAYRLYNKPHRDPSREVGIKVEAIKLFADFQTDEAQANSMYLGKTLEVNGVVT